MAKKAAKKEENKLNLEAVLMNCRNYLRSNATLNDKRDLLLTLVFLRFIGEKFEVTQAVNAAKNFFREGYGYKKAGVIATRIVPAQNVMHNLFEDVEAAEREHKITSVLDSLNSKFGKSTVKLAVQGSGHIKTSSENQSPHYTTRWSDIPKVLVK